MELTSRRYIGSKAKLLDWIFFEIEKNTVGNSFFDIFAGTGCVAERASSKYEKVFVNDILYSNKVIYEAFWSNEEFNNNKVKGIIEYINSIDSEKLEGNYFSNNFANKYFGENDSKKIGFTREYLNNEKKYKNINDREYNILLASLIYSMDKIANTVGHYEAYRKVNIKDNRFKLNLISVGEKIEKNISIFREDANVIADAVKADIVFLDPPYNSRQYSRFYHVLENLVEWKKPELFGVALKPNPENMSDYCRNNAPKVFEDLVSRLKCKYIVVTYNNTYNSKSNSSKNKITFDEIISSLNKRGETKVFEASHRFFNAGKTDFSNHKEYLFITEVRDEE